MMTGDHSNGQALVDSGLPSGTTMWMDGFPMAIKQSPPPQCDMGNLRNNQSKGSKSPEVGALYLVRPIAVPREGEGWNRLPLNRRIEDPSDRLRGFHTYGVQTANSTKTQPQTDFLQSMDDRLIPSDHLGRSHVRIFRKGITPVHRRRSNLSTKAPRNRIQISRP